MLGQWSVVIVL